MGHEENCDCGEDHKHEEKKCECNEQCCGEKMHCDSEKCHCHNCGKEKDCKCSRKDDDTSADEQGSDYDGE